MSSAAPVNATPAAPVLIEVDAPTVTVDTGCTHPVDLHIDGKVYGLTPEEALDLATQLLEAANKAREAGA